MCRWDSVYMCVSLVKYSILTLALCNIYEGIRFFFSPATCVFPTISLTEYFSTSFFLFQTAPLGERLGVAGSRAALVLLYETQLLSVVQKKMESLITLYQLV